MSTVLISVVVALVFLILGVAAAVLAFYLWTVLQVIKKLNQSVDAMTKMSSELLGEGSFSRISKSLSTLSKDMPDMLLGLKEFSRVMKLFSKTALDPEKVAAAESDDEPSKVYGYSEETAAVHEAQAIAAKNKIHIPDEDLRQMRTDEPS